MTKSVQLHLVVAATESGGIGVNGGLPWRLKQDMQFFRQLTMGSPSAASNPSPFAVLMGRKTWESIPAKFRPLPDRLNVVLSRNCEFLTTLPEGVLGFTSMDDAISHLGSGYTEQSPRVLYVIGGGNIYSEAMTRPECQRIYLTRVFREFDCDTFLSTIDESIWHRMPTEQTEKLLSWSLPLQREEAGVGFEFQVYQR